MNRPNSDGNYFTKIRWWVACVAVALTTLLQGCGSRDDGVGVSVAPGSDAGAPPAIPLVVESIAPQKGVPGTTVTVRGSGFTRNTQLLWGDTVLPTVFQSAQALTFQLPPTHAAGDVMHAVALKREDGVVQFSTQPVVVLAVPEPTSFSPSSAREGQIIRVVGANLQLIKRIELGQTVAQPFSVAADGSWMEFLVPTQAPNGSVVAYDANDNAFALGALQVIGQSLTLSIDDVEVSQGQLISVSQATVDPYLRLVPQRDTLVRVRLAPNSSGTPQVPVVRLTVSNTALGSQTFVMQGPSTLGANSVVENDLDGSYTYVIPGAWIGPGFQMVVAANEATFPLSVARFAYTPSASVLKAGTYIRMHVVPIAPDTGERLNFDQTWFTNNLKGVYPLSDIDVVIEPPLVGPGTNTSDDWLEAVDSLRAASSPKNYDFYFGAMPYDGKTGLGYMPGRTAIACHLWYGRQDYSIQGVVMHEIGHNFGRDHSFSDSNFPYSSSNWVGGPWASVIDIQGKRQYVDPSVWHDVMSYDYPKTVSDYTYSGAYDYLEQNLPLSAKPAANEQMPVPRVVDTRTAADSIYLRGSWTSSTGKVTLAAPVRMQAAPDTLSLAPTQLQSDSDYVLEVATNNARFRYPLQLQKIADAQTPHFSFEITIPAVEGIVSMRVLRGLSELPTMTASQAAKPQAVRSMSAPANAVIKPWGSYRVNGSNLEVTWDANHWPWLSVWQKTISGLVPLSIARTGGVLKVPLRAAVAESSGLVVSLSDGLNTTLEAVGL